ncbi:MAG: HAD-IA family hydrolase [Hymenobacteraceae bacterium]|nr:HAD-IA family hydrolase [Hymenobacteraceae bacterium]
MSLQTLFLDIGGVLGTNGWDTAARQRAADHFGFDFAEFNARHKRLFDQYETGHLTLAEYLRGAVFHVPRAFSEAEFTDFMRQQSVAWPVNIAFFRELKQQHGLRVFAVNNEGRELNDHRFATFGFGDLFDAAVSSCYAGMRKPDPRLYRLALDLSQTPAADVLVIDDRPEFTEIAAALGLNTLRYESLAVTQTALTEQFDLS